MAYPQEIVEAIGHTLDNAPELPDDVSYLTQEPDVTGSDSNIKLPVCSIQQIGTINLRDFNTDLAGVITDSNGNNVGRIYESRYRLDVQIDLWVAQGSKHNPDELGAELRQVLYNYDDSGPGGTLRDENGQDMADVWRFHLGDGERRDDLTMTPTLRRWRQEASMWSHERFDTTEDAVAGVNYPQSGDFSGGDTSDIIMMLNNGDMSGNDNKTI